MPGHGRRRARRPDVEWTMFLGPQTQIESTVGPRSELSIQYRRQDRDHDRIVPMPLLAVLVG